MGLTKPNVTSFKKGHVPWNKEIRGYRLWPDGRTISDTHLAAIREAGKRRRGKPVKHARQFKKGQPAWNKGIAMVHRGSFRDGAEHPNWQGGITPVIMRRCHHRRWRVLRRTILARDQARCQWCGTDRGCLTIHHIDHDPWNHTPRNLITLCRYCHAAVTNGDKNDTRIAMADLLWMAEQGRPDMEVCHCNFV